MDVTVPDLGWPFDAVNPSSTALPLAVITKTDMRQFDAADASGASIPILSTADNAVLSRTFLERLVEAENGIELDEADREDIASIVEGAPGPSLERALRLVARRNLSETVTEQQLIALAESFVLFALLPYDRVGSRTVVKFSYQWTSQPRVTGSSWIADRFRRVAAAAGLVPYGFAMELANVQTGSSSHLEVAAPPGLHCVDLVLYAADDTEVAADREPGPAAHVHTTKQPPGTWGLVRFDPDLAGVHRVMTWSTWAVAALLTATYLRLDQVSSDPGTPVSLLLFGPAILLAFLVRPGESWIVSAVTGPLRALAVTLAGVLFSVGFALSTGFHPAPHAQFLASVADIGWRGGVVVSVLSGMVLGVGRFSVRRRQIRGGARRG